MKIKATTKEWTEFRKRLISPLSRERILAVQDLDHMQQDGITPTEIITPEAAVERLRKIEEDFEEIKEANVRALDAKDHRIKALEEQLRKVQMERDVSRRGRGG